jgi:hypothetical protein
MLNIEQQQSFLRDFVGLNLGSIDGIRGKNTIKAIKAFQSKSGLVSDGIWGKKTEAKAQAIIWKKYPNFKRSEFECKCGCKCDVEMYTELLDILQSVRDKYKKAVVVNSGIRCKTHNKNVGGVSNSRHLRGKAADIKISGVSGNELKSLAYKLGCRYSYVITGNSVHIDI